MTTPTGGSDSTPPPEPLNPPNPAPKPLTPSDEKAAFLLNTPFAKMFEATGQMPTVQEIKAIIDQVLQNLMNQQKIVDQNYQKAMRKIKEEIEGNN